MERDGAGLGTEARMEPVPGLGSAPYPLRSVRG